MKESPEERGVDVKEAEMIGNMLSDDAAVDVEFLLGSLSGVSTTKKGRSRSKSKAVEGLYDGELSLMIAGECWDRLAERVVSSPNVRVIPSDKGGPAGSTTTVEVEMWEFTPFTMESNEASLRKLLRLSEGQFRSILGVYETHYSPEYRNEKKQKQNRKAFLFRAKI